MHTSDLRGSDFQITRRRLPIDHGVFFESITLSDRLGFVAEHALDGLGAAGLILAHITAFYDRYRAQGTEFFAYPDYFSFQRQHPVTDYGMLDIYPHEKNVHLPGDPWDALSTVVSRAITILVVPEGSSSRLPEPEVTRERATLESLRRSVRACYLYSPSGQVSRGDTTLCCMSGSVEDWGKEVIARTPAEHSECAAEWTEGRWRKQFVDGKLTQSYQQIELEDAIARIVNREAVTRS